MSARRTAVVARLTLALSAACGVTALAAACKKPDAAKPEAGGRGRGGGGAGGKGAVFAVDTMKVEAKKLDYVVTAPATLEAFERVQVTARVAGVIDRVAFSEGQSVKKGDVLVVIDSERFRLAVNSAKAQLEKSRAAQADIEAMVVRRENASEEHPGLIPGEELATYKTKSLTAKADTAVAQESLKTAELNLRDSAVRAPIEGVIQTRTVETGQYVNPGYVMATLLRQEPMLLRFQVEPQEAPRIKPQMPVTFTLRETQRTYDGHVTLVAGAADPQTHMVAITAQVDADDHKYWLRPGSFCDVAINVGATRDAPVIPRLATRATDHGYVVYVIDDKVAVERPITLGMSSKDGWVEVLSVHAAGDSIVVRGGQALSPGAKVRAHEVTSLDGGLDDDTEPSGDPPAKEGEGSGDRPRARGDGGERRGGGRDGGRRRPRPEP